MNLVRGIILLVSIGALHVAGTDLPSIVSHNLDGRPLYTFEKVNIECEGSKDLMLVEQRASGHDTFIHPYDRTTEASRKIAYFSVPLNGKRGNITFFCTYQEDSSSSEHISGVVRDPIIPRIKFSEDQMNVTCDMEALLRIFKDNVSLDMAVYPLFNTTSLEEAPFFDVTALSKRSRNESYQTWSNSTSISARLDRFAGNTVVVACTAQADVRVGGARIPAENVEYSYNTVPTSSVVSSLEQTVSGSGLASDHFADRKIAPDNGNLDNGASHAERLGLHCLLTLLIVAAVLRV